MSGLLRPAAGRILVEGEDVTGRAPDKIVKLGVCHVPEGRRIFANLTVLEHLRMGAYARPAGEAASLEKVLSLFPRLRERLRQAGGTLSGGEQQMLAMARALATEPALLLLDELSMGLAPIIVQGLYEQVAEIAADGLSIVVVEQFAHEVLGVADTAAIMLHGKVRRVGPPERIAEELTEAYLAGSTG